MYLFFAICLFRRVILLMVKFFLSCMFKLEQSILEELSFTLDERDIANFKKTLEYMNSKNLLTISQDEVINALRGLDVLGKLKLEGKIYAFHVEDTYADLQSGKGDGIELYLRQGNVLKDFYVPGLRDFVYSEDDIITKLHETNISLIYTGPIPYNSEFLGIPYESDNEDSLIRDVLRDYEIDVLKSENIQVVKLDSLI